jgi:hypothetical protein
MDTYPGTDDGFDDDAPVPRFKAVQRIAALEAAARLHAGTATSGHVVPHWDITVYADKLLAWLRQDD